MVGYIRHTPFDKCDQIDWSLSLPLPLSLSLSHAPREVKLSVVSYLTNSIVDQILQELYATHKALVNCTHSQCLCVFVCVY